MKIPNLRLFQRVWRKVHLCIGAGLLLLLGSIALSGAALVWKAPLDAMLNPGRYAITGGKALPPAVFIKNVMQEGFEPLTIQFDTSNRGPVIVTARKGTAAAGERPNFSAIYFDPPTARILDVVDSRTSAFGLLHRFHENLTIPEYGGRSVIGWMGVAMLTSVLTGIYLWWPRNGGLRQGLKWQRGAGTLSNLHHMAGIWIALPLGVVAITGVYLGFPQQSRNLLSSIFETTQPTRGGFAAQPLHPTMESADEALKAALKIAPDTRAATIALPTKQQGVWRIELYSPGTSASMSVIVDDASGIAKLASPPLLGDRVAAWLRWIHEGSHAGWLWRCVVFLCGVAPPLLGVTGVIFWLQRHSRRRSSTTADLRPSPEPAE